MTKRAPCDVDEILRKYDYLPKALTIRLTGRSEEDLEQIVRIKVWKSFTNHYDGSSSPRTFYFNAARTAIITELRKKQRIKEHELQLLDRPIVGEEAQLFSELFHDLKAINPESVIKRLALEQFRDEAIAALPSHDWQLVIVLHYLEELTLEEVAAEMGITVGSVSNYRNQALAYLRVFFMKKWRKEGR